MSDDSFSANSVVLRAVQQFLDDLRYADWQNPIGPIRFSRSLNLGELQRAPFFVNTRIFLRALSEDGGADLTATGNLNRAFVTKLFDRLTLPKSYREMMRNVCKVLNELDVWDLHLVRVVSEIAGLVQRRKKRVQLTKRGRELLADEHAGTLYRELFFAYFLKFDWHYDFHLREAKWIQTTMAATLWRLDSVIENWRSVRGLASQVLLPRVYDDLRAAMINPHDTEEWIFSGYALAPLSKFGLIEKDKGDDWVSVSDDEKFRLTPLWKRFIAFGFESNFSQN